jgi:hypothetical protein
MSGQASVSKIDFYHFIKMIFFVAEKLCLEPDEGLPACPPFVGRASILIK